MPVQARKLTHKRRKEILTWYGMVAAASKPLRRIIEIPGSKPRPYVVDLFGPHGHTGDCPDWLYNKRITGGICKHIDRAVDMMVDRKDRPEQFRDDWFSPIGGTLDA